MTTQPMPIEEAVEVAAVDAIVAKVGRESRLTIPLLQAVQAHYGYLPRAALLRLCEVADLTPAQVGGVASFYSSSAACRSAATSSASATAPPATWPARKA